MGSRSAKRRKAREARAALAILDNQPIPSQLNGSGPINTPGRKQYAGAKMGDVTKDFGTTGLKAFRGIINEEYLPQLKGTRLMKVYQMMDDDAVIGTLLDAVKMPLSAAEFSVVAASDEEPDKLAAEFLEQNMDDMNDYTWRQHVNDALTFLTYGYTLHEIIMKKRLGPEGNPPSKFNDGRMGIKILDPRGQDTIYRWGFDDDYNVEEVFQRHYGKEYTLPYWKLLHGTFRGKKRSPEGRSLLRSLYRAWRSKDGLEAVERIGAERDLAGLPIIYLPTGATPDDQAYAEVLGTNIRLDEQVSIVCPAPPAGAEHGWKIELLRSGGAKSYDIRRTIEAYITIILMRFFAQFLKLGMDQVGSQSLVKGAQSFFSLGLLAVQQEILEMWNHKLVPYLFQLNSFPGMTDLPRIDWAPPGKTDISDIVTVLKEMTGANIITPSEDLEDWIRELAGMPERPENIGVGPRERPTPATNFIIKNLRNDSNMLDDVAERFADFATI